MKHKATVIVLAGAVAAYAVPFVTIATGDFQNFLLPWYYHIVHGGRIGVFAHPFSNYSPPYLYLLAAATVFDRLLPPLISIKLLSALGAVWVALAVFRLFAVVGAGRAEEGAAWSLLLPTVCFNVAFLAQADTFWVAPCVLAVAAAIRREMFGSCVWASVGFAFKAQAVFIAPIVAAGLIRGRAPILYWLLPAAVYLISITPALLAGWPMRDLLTVYIRQAQWSRDGFGQFVSTAPNPWLLLRFASPRLAVILFPIGYVAAAAGAALVMRRPQTLGTSALCAGLIPWLLPGMHERYFALAEVLAFALAWAQRDRFAIAAAVFLQVALALAVATVVYPQPALAISAFVAEGVGLALLLWLSADTDHTHDADSI